MKTEKFIDKIVNSIINVSLNLIIKLTGNLPLKWIMPILNLYGRCFSPHFRKQFRSDSAKFHVVEFCQISDHKFLAEHIKGQLFSLYLRRYLFANPKHKSYGFVQKCIQNSREVASGTATKIYLCTHSGDYWLSILNIAFHYRDNPSSVKQLIVPIYELITEENSKVFSKIDIPGFNVIFINIHESGALKKITTYLRDDISAVALFYDLFCYAAGTLNGAVENVSFFNRSAYMTTGFSSLVVRLNLSTRFVSTHYCHQDKKFITSFSPEKNYTDVEVLRTEMVNYLEKYISEYPAQWYFIAYLDTFYHYPFLHLQNIQKNKVNSYLRLQKKYQS